MKKLPPITGWWFVPVHFTRNAAWAAAVVVWMLRRLRGVASDPSHSMHPRPASPSLVRGYRETRIAEQGR
jgi:hypothetical protein